MAARNVKMEEWPEWDERHHISGSTHNARLPHCLRNYFDGDRHHCPMKCTQAIYDPSVIPLEEYTLDLSQIQDSDEPPSLENKTEEVAQEMKVSVADAEPPDEKTRGSYQRRTFRRTATKQEMRQRKELELHVKKLYESAQRIPHLSPFADFYLWAINRFKNLTRCWRMFDSNLNMRLHAFEFYNGLRKFNYPDRDGRFMFKILDRERSGTLLYHHFDPCGADDLATLVEWCNTNFGSVQDAFRKLDKDKNGTITLAEFQSSTKQHGFKCQRAIACVFEMLDVDLDRKVTAEEMEFLDRWKCPAWLKAEPDDVAAEEFKARLLKKYGGNSIKAWHVVLDTNQSMRVDWDEFARACSELHYDRKKVAAVWRSIDANLSGCISLREFDQRGYELLLKFKNYCVDHHGGVMETFKALDENQNGIWCRKDFDYLVDNLVLKEHEADYLFDAFDLRGKGKIPMSALKYVDTWNAEEEERDEEFWEIISEALRTKVVSDHMEGGE
eukprot:gnl/MRDRNA2_/MRDRNA2_65376_c0_seq2.p1 gnl/MRDRNA2_/MRDRNA2_65376_c0~~gnl/MRDRNA2_/MRDRNA2_65376_c0_seq2.p1  ORF type:complete len:585 (+),score=108.34 gnl/MRDRNA2_/MRDRNA2_65376_c0_seq2:259-1755(+)